LKPGDSAHLLAPEQAGNRYCGLLRELLIRIDVDNFLLCFLRHVSCGPCTLHVAACSHISATNKQLSDGLHCELVQFPENRLKRLTLSIVVKLYFCKTGIAMERYTYTEFGIKSQGDN